MPQVGTQAAKIPLLGNLVVGRFSLLLRHNQIASGQALNILLQFLWSGTEVGRPKK